MCIYIPKVLNATIAINCEQLLPCILTENAHELIELL